MKLSEIASALNLTNANLQARNEDVDISSGYVCDLLSQVLASAKEDSIWITVQSHLNIIGVAVMTGISAIIVSEGHDIPEQVLQKADDEQIAMYQSRENGFQLSGKLYQMGIK